MNDHTVNARRHDEQPIKPEPVFGLAPPRLGEVVFEPDRITVRGCVVRTVGDLVNCRLVEAGVALVFDRCRLVGNTSPALVSNEERSDDTKAPSKIAEED